MRLENTDLSAVLKYMVGVGLGVASTLTEYDPDGSLLRRFDEDPGFLSDVEDLVLAQLASDVMSAEEPSPDGFVDLIQAIVARHSGDTL